MGADDRSLFERFFGMVRHNLPQIAMDIALLAAWLLIGTEVLRLLGVPRWLQYLVLFAGVLVYAQLTPAWEQPPARDE